MEYMHLRAMLGYLIQQKLGFVAGFTLKQPLYSKNNHVCRIKEALNNL